MKRRRAFENSIMERTPCAELIGEKVEYVNAEKKESVMDSWARQTETPVTQKTVVES